MSDPFPRPQPYIQAPLPSPSANDFPPHPWPHLKTTYPTTRYRAPPHASAPMQDPSGCGSDQELAYERYMRQRELQTVETDARHGDGFLDSIYSKGEAMQTSEDRMAGVSSQGGIADGTIMMDEEMVDMEVTALEEEQQQQQQAYGFRGHHRLPAEKDDYDGDDDDDTQMGLGNHDRMPTPHPPNPSSSQPAFSLHHQAPPYSHDAQPRLSSTHQPFHFSSSSSCPSTNPSIPHPPLPQAPPLPQPDYHSATSQPLQQQSQPQHQNPPNSIPPRPSTAETHSYYNPTAHDPTLAHRSSRPRKDSPVVSIAEAAKRAEVACMVRDMGEVEL